MFFQPTSSTKSPSKNWQNEAGGPLPNWRNEAKLRLEKWQNEADFLVAANHAETFRDDRGLRV